MDKAQIIQEYFRTRQLEAARKRWKGTTPEARSAIMRKVRAGQKYKEEEKNKPI